MDNYNDTKSGMRKLNLVFSVCGEKNSSNEDSYSYCFDEKGGYIAVYDGFGEADSTIYPEFGNKTGGYFASRLAADITLQMFRNNNFTFSQMDSIKLGSDMKKYIDKLNRSVGAEEKKPLLPTTASIIACNYSDDNSISFEYLWAGNSRGYVIDKNGLGQITEDDVVEKTDLAVSDEDERLVNLINAETDFKIHSRMVKSQYPAMVITATDGAFKCFATPMEFEYAILYTLNRAKSISQWESLLNRLIGEFADDDYSIMVAAFGFEDFKDLKHYYFDRTKYVFSEYISPMSQTGDDAETVIKEMWKKYKEEYYR